MSARLFDEMLQQAHQQEEQVQGERCPDGFHEWLKTQPKLWPLVMKVSTGGEMRCGRCDELLGEAPEPVSFQLSYQFEKHCSCGNYHPVLTCKDRRGESPTAVELLELIGVIAYSVSSSKTSAPMPKKLCAMVLSMITDLVKGPDQTQFTQECMTN